MGVFDHEHGETHEAHEQERKQRVPHQGFNRFNHNDLSSYKIRIGKLEL